MGPRVKPTINGFIFKGKTAMGITFRKGVDSPLDGVSGKINRNAILQFAKQNAGI